MFEILMNLSLKILILVALGYILRRKNVITERFQKDITRFMMDVALPASILTAANSPLSRELAAKLGLFGIATALFYVLSIALGGVIARFLPLDEKGRKLFISMLIFDNIAFIGFPLTTELLGAEGTLFNAIANIFFIFFFYTLGITLISGKATFEPKTLLKVPASIAAIAALLIYFSGLRFPAFLLDTCSTLGGMVTPISMLVIGCSLASIPLPDILKDPMSYLISLLRLVIVPFALLFLLRLLPFLPSDVILAASLLAALPTGTMCLIFSQQYDNHPDYASRTVVQGMLFMIVTIPVFFYAASTILGLS